MSVKRKAERDRQTRMYCETIEIPKLRQKLIAALRVVTGTEGRTTLFELMDALDERQWRICVQLTQAKIEMIPAKHLSAVIKRWKTGDDAGRSFWRRLCKKYKVDTSPAGYTRNMEAYNREKYLSQERAKGKRLSMIFKIKDLVDDMIISDVSAMDCKRVMPQLSKMLEYAIEQK